MVRKATANKNCRCLVHPLGCRSAWLHRLLRGAGAAGRYYASAMRRHSVSAAAVTDTDGSAIVVWDVVPVESWSDGCCEELQFFQQVKHTALILVCLATFRRICGKGKGPEPQHWRKPEQRSAIYHCIFFIYRY